VLAYEVVFLLGAAWAHADVRVPARLESAMRQVLVTPGLHAIHHSAAVGDADRNFSAVSIVWDRLFGTYAAASAHPGPIRFGLRDIQGGRPDALGWLLLLPFRRPPP
jgi:sterol desaturase/sphingolipid hydroxylase (fatty acid hydroxylase superfamily)